MNTTCATRTLTLTRIPTNTASLRGFTCSRLTALTARLFTIAATSMLLEALLYGIASSSTSAGMARYLAIQSAAAQPVGRARALVAYAVLAATAGATLGHVAQSDLIRAFEILRHSLRQVLDELEMSWATAQMRHDPRYSEIAHELRSS